VPHLHQLELICRLPPAFLRGHAEPIAGAQKLGVLPIEARLYQV
jgi:hypothetical protein